SGIGTDDTSNFGPLRKLKIEPATAISYDLAEAGMSGGPVVDRYGRVVGVATERPNDTNSLIAIDLTSINITNEAAFTRTPTCSVRFNPCDRRLAITNEDAFCDYGKFGSRLHFPQLKGRWILQE